MIPMVISSATNTWLNWLPRIFWVLVVIGVVILVRRSVRWVRGNAIGVLLRALRGESVETRSVALTDEINRTPKSLSSLESFFGPQIAKDFPELNLHELRQQAAQVTLQALEAVRDHSLKTLRKQPQMLREDVRQLFDRYPAGRMNQITVHQTVVNNYEKQAGTCQIRFQSSACASLNLPGSPQKQFRANLTALYIQDPVLADLQQPQMLAFALNCPNCGAPITQLGIKFCAHCGTGVETLNRRVWRFTDFDLLD